MESHIEVLSLKQFTDFLRPRARDANKGSFGHVLVVGGDYGYFGAVKMASEAALRVGAGLVSVATRPENAETMNATRPELMCHGITASAQIKPLIEKATVIVIGPGLGRTAWAQKLLYFVLKSKKPLIVDADALNLLASQSTRNENWILTPHPGEASRLLKTSVEEIQFHRLPMARQLQTKFGGVCVLKGMGTLVIGPRSEAVICEAGNPGMATGGMGDILSGVIAGLVAQGMTLFDGAKLGVLIHALAGDLAAKESGERGMIATDLMPFIRRLVNES